MSRSQARNPAWPPTVLVLITRMPALATVILFAAMSAGLPADAPSWIAPMREVHARFRGQPGTFAHFGDSITVTLAFWTPLLYERKNAPEALEQAFARVKARLRPECWRDWKGPEYGSEGGMTIRWAHENVEKWLVKLNPEVALIMFGTNDLGQLELDEYRTKLRQVVERCLESGTVVILSTIPPRSGALPKAKAFAGAVREVARQLNVPVTDYQAEILRRRPDDWDGTMERFKDPGSHDEYDVPTLICRDGVHPSNPAKYRDDYSEEGLSCSGYGLRSAMALLAYDEVIRALTAEKAAPSAPGRQEPAKASAGAAQPAPPASAAKAGGTSQEASQKLSIPPWPAWLPKASPLSPPKGMTIEVGDLDGLFAAAEKAKPGDIVLVAPGVYDLPRKLELRTDRLTLRGRSGKPEEVVLDGGKARLGELVGISRSTGVTIADLTIRNALWNGFKINSETGVQALVVSNCIIHNIWERGVKGVKVPTQDRERLGPKACRIERCLFYNDRAKDFSDDPNDTSENFNGNYVGGIDVMYAKDWTISDNVFVGIRGRTGEARGAVFLWHEAEGCVVERNVILDCDSGICLGNSHKPEDVRVHASRCIVRNNFVSRAHENGILADYTENCRILNNTVHDPESRLGRLIRLVHDNFGLVVANNLLDGPPIRNESSSTIDLRTNLEGKLSAWLADPAKGDLHLKRSAGGAIDSAARLDEVTDDIDGTPRGERPDVGADELERSPEGIAK